MATPEKQLEQTVFLDPDQKSPRAQEFEERLEARIVGQERAVRRMTGLYQIFLAGLNPINRPIGTMLFLGPTGSGKTRVIEAAAEVLFGDPNAVVKIDCAEFQHSHEIAKLIGSPPGYLGHRETSPMLTQENLDRMIFTIAVRVRRDVRIEQPGLAFAHTDVRVFQLNATIEDALYFGPQQRRARLIFRGDMIVMKRRPVSRQDLLFLRRCH